MKPNLFHFATSELSQDAFLCWLLSWAKPECSFFQKDIHQVGLDLINLIYKKSDLTMPEQIKSLKVEKQTSNIDILCVVNADTAILIEDKVGTQQHSNQLAIYRDHIIQKLGYPQDKVALIYLQTGDQSNFDEVVKQGYKSISRADLLTVLESATAYKARQHSDILDCFAMRMRQVEDDVQSYRTQSLKSWSGNAWKGFYARVQSELGEGRWEYVANASGGFLGYWWHFRKIDSGEIYLQLEETRFCFKVVASKAANRKDFGNKWSAQVINKAVEFGLKAVRPSRVRSGDYMTIALLEKEYRIPNNDGTLNFDETVALMRRAESVLESLISNKK